MKHIVRRPGYYRVKRFGQWLICQWNGKSWWFAGLSNPESGARFDDVDETPINVEPDDITSEEIDLEADKYAERFLYENGRESAFIAGATWASKRLTGKEAKNL